MNTSPATDFAQRLFRESGLTSSHEPIDVSLVSDLLEEHYRLTGGLGRLATEKDDTFRLGTDSGDYLVKVSPPDEAEAVVALQTAAMRHLETTAPHLPVQRVKLTADADDHVQIRLSGGRTRILRVFHFVEGPVLADVNPDAERLSEAGGMLGLIDVALRPFTHPADRRGLAWDLRHFHRLTELVEHTPNPEHRQLARSVFRLFGEHVVPRLSDLETQVIHGDFSPYNIVVEPQSDHFVTGVIDFGDTVRSAVIFDPAVPMANLLGRTPDEPWQDACAFAAGYQRERPIQAPELPLLPVAALARLTLRALITNWRAERAPERRDYLLGHAKDDWINIERSLTVSLDHVVAHLREARHGRP
ncbi:phosphotransferase [Streptomyces djakartensis]|uniref:Hydroxylysine kinase n=1 Tax=Streptomyces djakartensis TaxID=68193 RepID=A0ABQ2ZIT0_9ACTN|nr:phosphotransferase [Streptomyces djakartensis]GGY17610.1 homoserine kinase [Streptomyces djakartensis]